MVSSDLLIWGFLYSYIYVRYICFLLLCIHRKKQRVRRGWLRYMRLLSLICWSWFPFGKVYFVSIPPPFWCSFYWRQFYNAMKEEYAQKAGLAPAPLSSSDKIKEEVWFLLILFIYLWWWPFLLLFVCVRDMLWFLLSVLLSWSPSFGWQIWWYFSMILFIMILKYQLNIKVLFGSAYSGSTITRHHIIQTPKLLPEKQKHKSTFSCNDYNVKLQHNKA